ncbi:MAG: hypothetical protein ACYC8T_23135 [Myxococcaceae bacterium]
MAKINRQPPAPMWPWGAQSAVREKKIDRAQLNRSKKAGKKGDPKNPAIASSALMDSIGPAHSAEELRLPLPPHPDGHDADLEGDTDRPHLASVAERSDGDARMAIDRGLGAVRAAPDRLERLKALLGREAQMLNLVGQLSQEVAEIQRKIREEQKDSGF